MNTSITSFQELENKKPNKRLPPLFYAHGDIDNIVLWSWGRDTFEKLESLGVQGEFHTVPNTLHKLRKQEIELLFDWINKLVPNQ
jgi:phospholipase/carboxylesterase